MKPETFHEHCDGEDENYLNKESLRNFEEATLINEIWIARISFIADG